ncbi:hypothetical protein LV84_00477 [Algoriphagus ratkowskyi]|uniref:Uncharacterized protein n=1 Tax=Algoriphagus ratkowskyi TaxID=57028 RepID=A0A2W7RYB1_9BACT|nr:hypothetical protein [Algoriphagus ratkowskyi]PZX60207.1 hypothetical protein LV84_00477 [Algoriphagus ratkowskyi]TXD78032.1 hypothetical protein ESW18_08255 [Algoriphagus ratkowskyi]
MTTQTQTTGKAIAFDQIREGIREANLQAAEPTQQADLKAQLQNGLLEMRSGLEKIRLSESLFKDDQFLFDWLSILSSRIDIFEESIEL